MKILKGRTATLPTTKQVLYRMAQLLVRWFSYAVGIVVFILIAAYSLLTMIVSFCTIWMPWPHDTFSQISLIWGFLLWLLFVGFGGFRLYQRAYMYELLRRNAL